MPGRENLKYRKITHDFSGIFGWVVYQGRNQVRGENPILGKGRPISESMEFVFGIEPRPGGMNAQVN